MSWTTIWNEDGAILDRKTQGQVTTAATFLLEGRRGSEQVRPSPLWHGAGEDALSLTTSGDGRVALRHRAMHLQSEPGIVQPGEAFQLVYRHAEHGAASLELRSLDRPGVSCVTTGRATTSMLSTDFVPVEPVIDRFGGFAAVANHDAPTADRAGLQAGTMVATPAGPRPVEFLQTGDVVLLENGGHAIVQAVERTEMVSLGSMNAVMLRAPYFGLTEDVHVSRCTPICLSGPEVEYTFGTETVMADAGDLVDNVSILRDLSKPVRDFVTVDLDRPGCLLVGRLQVGGADSAKDRPVIDRLGAQSILATAGGVSRLVK